MSEPTFKAYITATRGSKFYLYATGIRYGSDDYSNQLHETWFFAKWRYRKMKRRAAYLNKARG